MTRYAIALLALAMFGPLLTPAVPAAVSSDDTSFIQSAQGDALGQYALASLAQNKTQDPKLKSLAEQIAMNANKANDFIKNYAKTHDVEVDNKPSLRATSQYGDISSLKGSSFDQTFANDIRIDTNIAQSDYQDEAQSGTDPALKAFAKQQLALLQQEASAAGKL